MVEKIWSPANTDGDVGHKPKIKVNKRTDNGTSESKNRVMLFSWHHDFGILPISTHCPVKLLMEELVCDWSNVW